MCNLYSLRKGPQAILDLARAMSSEVGNLEPRELYPDYAIPIVRGKDGNLVLTTARWGMPSSKKALFDAATKRADKLRARGKEVDFPKLLELEPDSGTTNVRNTSSSHWKPWLSPANRCLIPFTAFSEPGRDSEGRYRPVWFRLAGADPEPLAFFAGIWLKDWTSVRKIKTGLESCDVAAFLTTEPNAEVAAVHPKAMPVILTTPSERDAWMRGAWDEVHELQRPLADGALTVMERGVGEA